MRTILAFERDIILQVEFLSDFKPQRPIDPKTALFCGSGDSLASCMIAECFSDYGARAMDPLFLAKNRNISKNKHVYFVSVSGSTISNIKAARAAAKSTAITKNQTSILAKTCDDVIVLDYADSKTMTSGSISFLASMLTCMSLVCRFKVRNPKKLFMSAKTQAKKIPLRNKVYFLGNQHTYPISMYAAAKLHEVLGLDAHYERLEQFSHAGLFSAKRGDTVIIFDNDRHGKRLASKLRKLGISVHRPAISSNDKVSQVIFYTFVSQVIALSEAKRKHMADCYFITEKKIRNVSSSMIY